MVDKRLLESCIRQAAGDDTELADFMRKKYEANDGLAVSFVNGFTTTADYTTKTQALAADRKKLESETETLRKSLEAADGEKAKIMKDLANQRVTVATAQARLDAVKETYGLTDEDIPPVGDLVKTRVTGRVTDSTPDVSDQIKVAVDAARKDWESSFAKTLIPELASTAIMPAIWDEMNREHQELTGKTLSFKEKQEILKTAQEQGKPLMGVWSERYGIDGDDGLRLKHRDAQNETALREKWDKEQADARSKAALEVVSPRDQSNPTGAGISNAFQTQFKVHAMDPNAVPGVDGSKAGEGGSMTVPAGAHLRTGSNPNKIPAAQRVAAKFVEKGGIAGFQRKAF